MSPEAERIAALEGLLAAERRYSASLELRVRELDADEPKPALSWAARLTPGQAALMEALLRAYPRTLDKDTLNEMVPRRDHAEDRDSKIVDQYVWQVRNKLAPSVIETVRHIGYRCGADFHKQYGD